MLKRVVTPSPPPRQRSARAGLKIAWEPFGQVIEEALPQLRRHYAELELDDPFDPDWKSLLWMASQNRQRVAVVRDRGEIVGYVAGLWCSYLASRNARIVMVNAFYLEPSYRGNIRLVKQMLQMMANWGREVKAGHMEMAAQGVHRHKINRLLRYLGWRDTPDLALRYDL